MLGFQLAYGLIQSADRVLDVGGSAQPFRRADAVIDIMDYESRESKNSFLPETPERFSKSTWVKQDLADSTKPFPFRDQEFDFAVCGHVLEDLRDPFFVIREMQRVSKRGYIEVPSRFNEQMPWVEHKKICGHSHHRWLIDLKENPVTGENELVFVFKNHLLNVDRRYQVRKPGIAFHRPKLNPRFEVLSLYWNGPFKAYEDVLCSVRNSHEFMLETVQRANGLGRRLWDRSESFPTAFGGASSVHGITAI